MGKGLARCARGITGTVHGGQAASTPGRQGGSERRCRRRRRHCRRRKERNGHRQRLLGCVITRECRHWRLSVGFTVSPERASRRSLGTSSRSVIADHPQLTNLTRTQGHIKPVPVPKRVRWAFKFFWLALGTCPIPSLGTGELAVDFEYLVVSTCCWQRRTAPH